ncbi:hypothetical protein TVAG_390870 [Trichomonas vaginalis G3]|uniref:Uncharacterized protein n=1 Tax=Trichomonas vaginalis (strain ATCC PRA-98 / G3) TaxID=412133 RepID=A2FE01_TRIV3|nr:putative DNA-binding domain family [Trichomonas vaginalis G3]EAX96880.1 hypothetical protein TVAG_390870 [Trichomonas vaginalis G3]KAI5534797.1 putative DNA-binding domain family [Trichomonas vaginalis G3]|eukprot:XP_001309810.1 hypothetical protein [Trichomonas vaginalis G3]
MIVNGIFHVYSDRNFETALKNCGVECEINPIFKHLKLSSFSIPNSEDIIKIPENEEFPIKDDKKEAIKPISQEEFVEKCLQEILNQRKLQIENHANTTTSEFLLIEDTDEFIQVKRELNTYCAKISRDEGMDPPFHICEYTSCLNSAIPGFSYCTNHITLDPKFDTLPFFKRCSSKLSDQQCITPCSEKHTECCLHRGKILKSNFNS